VDSRNSHGTGCTYAAALAANLALGRDLREAVGLAKEYVAGAIRHGLPIGRGHGPMGHFWQGLPPAEGPQGGRPRRAEP
jgi:hydroxymethylpyrimidine/phosphomethylpyrimidine kinase